MSTEQHLNNSSPSINLYSTNRDNLISRPNQQLKTSEELQRNDTSGTMNINKDQFYSLDTNGLPSKIFFLKIFRSMLYLRTLGYTTDANSSNENTQLAENGN